MGQVNRSDLNLANMRPVFIGGIYRSGTTLMGAILGSHPNLAIPPRDRDWWRKFYSRYRRVRRDRGWQTFLDEFFSTYRTRELKLDEDRLRREADTYKIGDCSRVFALLLSAYAEIQGKPRWGEKTIFNHLYADQMFTAFPEARFIHMLRDPRDVVVSLHHARFDSGLRHWLVTYPGWVMMAWRQSVRVAALNASRYGHRYLIVRYEDLVRDPTNVVRDICRFLDEPFVPDMLTSFAQSSWKGRSTNSSFDTNAEGITSAPVGRYKKHLSPVRIWLCERMVGEEMQQHGYERSNPTLKARNWLQLIAFEVPVNLLRMSVRWGLRMAQTLLPRLAERRPPKWQRDWPSHASSRPTWPRASKTSLARQKDRA